MSGYAIDCRCPKCGLLNHMLLTQDEVDRDDLYKCRRCGVSASISEYTPYEPKDKKK